MKYVINYISISYAIRNIHRSKRHANPLVSIILMNYYRITREYKASCTVWKANNLMNFDEVLKQYEPMISASIRKLNIYRDHDHFRQVGRVALWQAWQRFDEDKGNLTAFAFRSIRGAMLDELKKESQFDEHNMPMEKGLAESVVDTTCYIDREWSNSVEEVLDLLTPSELQLIQWLFVEGVPTAECAGRSGISVAGVRKRRERMLVKLKGLLS